MMPPNIKALMATGLCLAILAGCAATEGGQMSPQQQTEFENEMMRTDPSDVGEIPPADRFGAY